MILCDMDTSWVLNELNQSNRESDDLFYDDWLLHFLASKGKETCSLRQTDQRYEELKLFVTTGDKAYFHSFLKNWYKKSRGCVWYNRHKYQNNETDTYLGYWNFEAGAVAKIFGLNKAEFKNIQYFPYDLL